MNILYEDTALVVLDKPAGLTSEEGVPAALRQRWGRPDAYVGVIHRLDTGVSGLMVYARTPGAAAALTKQVTESQQAYAILDGRAEAGPGAPAQPCFLKTYRAVIAGGPDEKLPAEGVLRDYLFKDSRKGRVFPVSRPRKGVKEAVLEYRIAATTEDGAFSLADITLSPEEYNHYLEKAYKEESFKKPRNFIGLTKSLPVAEMEALMIANIPAEEEEMRQLAQRR